MTRSFLKYKLYSFSIVIRKLLGNFEHLTMIDGYSDRFLLYNYRKTVQCKTNLFIKGYYYYY